MIRGRSHAGSRLRLALLPLLLAAAGVASATTVNLSAGAWQDADLVSLPVITPRDFTATTAGVVTMGLFDVHALMPTAGLPALATLYASISLPGVGQLSGGATKMFQITAGQVFTVTVYAEPPPGGGTGAYQIQATFTPTATVPLPPTLWLMSAGALLLLRMRRTARSVSTAAR